MNKEQITGIILDIFNDINNRSNHYDNKITEYTKTSSLEFDPLDQTCILLQIYTAFHIDLEKEDVFTYSTRICDIIDMIDEKLKLDEYCKTCNRYHSYFINIHCDPDHSDYLRMINNQPFCDYYVEKDLNNPIF